MTGDELRFRPVFGREQARAEFANGFGLFVERHIVDVDRFNASVTRRGVPDHETSLGGPYGNRNADTIDKLLRRVEQLGSIT